MAKKAATAKEDKTFIGVRLDREQAEQLQEMADERGISLNALAKSILGGDDPDPAATTAQQFGKSLDAQNAKSDDLHVKLQRLQALIAVRDRLDKKREQLNREKPEGIFAELFGSKDLQEWRKKLKLWEEKNRKIVAKIDELEEQMVEQETAEPEPEDAEELEEQVG